MSNFASRLFTQSFKLLFRISMILGHIVFVSMARAIWHLVSSGSNHEESDSRMTNREFYHGDVPPGTDPEEYIG